MTLPRLDQYDPIATGDSPTDGLPTYGFHVKWQEVMQYIESLAGQVGKTLEIDGGNASNTGTAYVAIDGGGA